MASKKPTKTNPKKVSTKPAKGRVLANTRKTDTFTTNSSRMKPAVLRDIEAVPVFINNTLTKDDMPKLDTISSDGVMFHVDRVDNQEPVKDSRSSSKMNISSIEDDDEEEAIAAATDKILQEVIPKDIVRVKFVKFVNLVSSRDFKEVVASNADEEITMSSNLLTELAGSQDRIEERKIPLVFLVGIAIGVVLTYIFFSTN